MVMREIELSDIQGSGGDKVFVRYDNEELVPLACKFEYDVMLSNYDSMSRGPDSCQVMVPRKLEISDKEGGWGPYPSVVLARALDGYGLRMQTIAVVQITGENDLSIVYSKNLEPDLKLLEEAKRAGLYARRTGR